MGTNKDTPETSMCPFCGCSQSRVIETRSLTLKGHTIRVRVRKCRYCKRPFRTKEVVDQTLKLPPNHRGKSNLIPNTPAPPELPPAPEPNYDKAIQKAPNNFYPSKGPIPETPLRTGKGVPKKKPAKKKPAKKRKPAKKGSTKPPSSGTQ